VYAPLDSRVRIPEAGHAYNRGSIGFDLYSCERRRLRDAASS
jgi:hypothetical protein